MKKIVLFTLILFVAMSIQAQSLIGNWKTKATIDENGDAITWFFTFKNNNEFVMKMYMETTDKEVGTIGFGLTLRGTYKRNGNTVNVTVDPKKSKGKLEKTNFTGEMADLVNESPEMKKTVTDMLQKQVNKDLTEKFANVMPLDGDLTINKLTSTYLELQSDDELMKCTRVK